MERDQLDRDRLEEAGWTVIRLWEHVPLETAIETVESALIARDKPTGDSSDGKPFAVAPVLRHPEEPRGGATETD